MTDTTLTNADAGEGQTPAPLTPASADAAAAPMYPNSPEMQPKAQPAAPAGQAGADGAQTPEQVKAAADTEAARVAALTPEQKAAEDKAEADKAAAASTRFAHLVTEGDAREALGDILQAVGKLPGITELEARELLGAVERTHQALIPAIRQELQQHQTAQWVKAADASRAETTKRFSAEQLGNAKAALGKVFDAATIAYLDKLRFTDSPQLVSAMLRVHQAIGEDTWVTGGAPGGNVRGDARGLYPNSKMNP